MSGLTTTTYSMWRLFRNCRMACKWRYIDELVPLTRNPNLYFGSVIHECLELWHGQRDLSKVIEHIDRTYANRAQNADQKADQKADWHLATAMMKAYAEHYAVEDFEVVALEKTFEGPIVSPETGAASRSFVLAGKVDGIVKRDGQYFLLEHKTASQIDAGYLERLWTDFQIILYAWYIERTLGITIAGIIYNVLVKARLRQSQGETEAEYEARRSELIAKSKTGKTSAKRRMPEDDESFQARLLEKYRAGDVPPRDALFVPRPVRRAARRIVGADQGHARCPPARHVLPQHRLLFPVRAPVRLLPIVPQRRQSQRHRKPLRACRPARRTAGRDR